MYAGSGSEAALAAWDKELVEKLGHLYPMLDAGELESWKETPVGLVALLLLCDQISRNAFRNTAKAWAYDVLSQPLAKKVVDDSALLDSVMKLNPAWASLLLHVFMHAENISAQEVGLRFAIDWLQNAKSGKYGQVAYADIYAVEDGIAFFAYIHADVIRRFGRFPSRNMYLGRENTVEENEALEKSTIFGSNGFDYKAAKEAYVKVKAEGKLLG
jgi:uncharacterized protein (DUF924 family)